MNGASLIEFAAQAVAAELCHSHRNFVRSDGNHAASAEREQRQRDSVIAGENNKIIGHRICERRHLRDISGSFLDADDVFDFREALHHGWIEIAAAAAWPVVKTNR